jgi:multidrug resistance efflux pump
MTVVRRSVRSPSYALLLALVASVGACGSEEQRLTGYVEGEERVLRSEVTGRIRTVPHGEGDELGPRDVVAEIEPSDIDARIATKRAELASAQSEVGAQEERIALTESTWQADVRARAAEVARARSALDLAEKTHGRQAGLRRSGTTSVEALDQASSQRDQATSVLQQAEEMLTRTEAEVHSLALARQELEVQKQRVAVAEAQLGELEVTRSKYSIKAPDVVTVVQTQLAWPGELAQPGTAVVSVLDPGQVRADLRAGPPAGPGEDRTAGRDRARRNAGASLPR